MKHMSDEIYNSFKKLVYDETGLLFPKERRKNFETGIFSVMEKEDCDTYEQYYEKLTLSANQKDLFNKLISKLTINETYFFRNSHHFKALKEEIFPSIIKRKEKEGQTSLRLWSAGCASGEEPYSLSILLDQVLENYLFWNIHILSTDINNSVLEKAMKAKYLQWSFRNTEINNDINYFNQKDDFFEFIHPIKNNVKFEYLNLKTGIYPSPITFTNMLDLIICRNVLIYFDDIDRQKIINNFFNCLMPGGFLVVGHSEHVDKYYDKYDKVRIGDVTVYKRPIETEKANVASSKSIINTIQNLKLSLKNKNIKNKPTSQIKQVYTKTESNSEENVAFDKIIAMGLEYSSKNNLKKAESMFVAAIEKDSLNPKGYYYLGILYQLKNEVEKSIEKLKKAIFLDRNFIMCHYSLAMNFMRLKEKKIFIKFLNNAKVLLLKMPPDCEVKCSDGFTAAQLLTTIDELLKIKLIIV